MTVATPFGGTPDRCADAQSRLPYPAHVTHVSRPDVRQRPAHAVMFGVATAALAAGAHVLGGGEAPGLVAVALLAAVAAGLGRAALPSRPSTGRVVGVVAATQALLHGLLALGAVASAPAAGVTMMSGMEHGAAASALGRGAEGSWSQLADHLLMGIAGPSGVLMTLAHLAAAALLGVWLAAADRVVTTLGSLAVAPSLSRMLRGVAADVHVAAVVRALWVELLKSRVATFDRAPLRRRLHVLEHVTRRGPPSSVAFSVAA